MIPSIVNGRICLLPKLTATIILAQIIGKIYNVELYYGNGTINLWKNSWRENINIPYYKIWVSI